MPKTTEKKKKIAKLPKGSHEYEKDAFDIADSLNKINSLGKSSRTGKKENADSYENIKNYSSVLFGMLKEKVKPDPLEVAINQGGIQSMARNIVIECGNYIDKNKGFRWSISGRARVREVKRLQKALTHSFLVKPLYDKGEGIGFDTYSQMYCLGPYISSGSTESDSKQETTATDTTQKKSDTEAAEKKEVNVNQFNSQLLNYDDVLFYGASRHLLVLVMGIEGAFKTLKAEEGYEESNRKALLEMCDRAQIYGEAGTKLIKMIYNSYRHEIRRNTNGRNIPPSFEEFIKA